MKASRSILQTHSHIKFLDTQLTPAFAGKGIAMFTNMLGIRTLSECCVESTFRYIFILLCLVILFCTASAADLKDGLINYWPLDGDATDSIGKHDGEVVGGSLMGESPCWQRG